VTMAGCAGRNGWAGKRATCTHASSSVRSPSIDLGFFAEAKLALQLRRAAAMRTERKQRFSEARPKIALNSALQWAKIKLVDH
jgi:hypothetical protein